MAKDLRGLTNASTAITLGSSGSGPVVVPEDLRGGGIGNYTTTERNAISGQRVDNNMIIYNTTTTQYERYSGGTRAATGFMTGGTWSALNLSEGGHTSIQTYTATNAYAVGDILFYSTNNSLYRVNTAVSSAPAAPDSNFTRISDPSTYTLPVADDATLGGIIETGGDLTISATGVATLSDNVVDAAALADDAVDTAAIVDEAVTNAKIADDTIAEAKLDIHNAPADGDILEYDTTNGMQWVTASEAQGIHGTIQVYANATAYAVGDFVIDTANYGIYRVITAVTISNSTSPHLNNSFKQVGGVKIYLDRVAYAVGELVFDLDDNRLYYVATAVPNTNVANPSGNTSFTRLDAYVEANPTGNATQHLLDINIDGTIYGLVFVNQQAEEIHLDGTGDADSISNGQVILPFNNTRAGVVPYANVSMVPNWDVMNAATTLKTVPLAFDGDDAEFETRGYRLYLNNDLVTTLPNNWLDFVRRPGDGSGILNADIITFDDDNSNFNTANRNQIVQAIDANEVATFVIVADHNNWAIATYTRAAGNVSVFSEDGNSDLSIASARPNASTSSVTLVASKGVPSSRVQFFFPFNTTGGVITGGITRSPAANEFLTANATFTDVHTVDLQDPHQFVGAYKEASDNAIYYNTDRNITRTVKTIYYGDYQGDFTAVFTYNTDGDITTVQYYHGDFGATGAVSSVHLVATKTITYNTNNDITSVAIT